jgi:hypothetical protein
MIARVRRRPNWSPYRHAANSGRIGHRCEQLESFAQPRQPDVVGRDALARIVEEVLACLDRFPAFLERREVPLLALAADDPEPALRLVEGEPPSDREGLNDLVGAEGVVAVQAG